ncbi:MAG: amidohydrolase [Gammaproteobacteria bacterium]|nr:MAG: amidohydrolase [Gammaproteobacteria bacterium]
MDAQRHVYADGAIAIRDRDIVAVGPTETVRRDHDARECIDGRRFVITPGYIDGHIHVTGDPLTRGHMPDNIEEKFSDKLTKWVLPRYFAHEPADERLSAKLAALEMLRSGTTCFLEAGTVRYLDEVFEGLAESGIRGRVGIWVEGRAFGNPADQPRRNDEAIESMERELQRFPARHGDALLAAWPILVGHSTNTDEVWQAAKALADQHGVGVSAHMSARQSDPDWFIEHTGQRPIVHLEALGVLGDNVCLTHVVRIDDTEFEALARTGSNVILCPLASLKGAFGISLHGRHPDMSEAGINLLLGSDGYNSDMLRLLHLTAGLFKDCRDDITRMTAEQALELITRNAARALQIQDLVGALEPGRRADLVCHDTWRPEWAPLTNPVNQLVWSADGRSVHSVWVDGRRVIDNYRSTLIDEDALYAEAQKAGDTVIKRSGLPMLSAWPIVGRRRH